MKRVLLFLLLAIISAGLVYWMFFTGRGEFKVLVFSKTASFRHESIPEGKDAIIELGKQHGFKVDTTENAEIFKEKNLKNYKVVVFLNTTGDVLNEAQQIELNRFVQAGGGFVGVHAAADTEYEWPWYGKLVGAYFDSHPNNPNVRKATIQVVDSEHESTSHLSSSWTREDEWYNYKGFESDLNILLKLDESSYEGGTNGNNHPIAWYKDFDGGRSFYTGLGHTKESYTDPDFIKHLWGGISYAAADGKAVNYNLSTVAPEENRFSKVVLDDYLDEPMEFELIGEGKILFVERPGNVRLFDPKVDSAKTIAKIPVFHELEDGLLGLALDPNFDSNNWIYLFYSPIGETPKQHISRFVFKDDQLDLSSEKVVLEIPTQRDQCCHSAGSMEFGPNGNLYISTGDNTNPHESDGYSPSDEMPNRSPWDAQKSSANTNDLRGKILRISPEDDGTYSIPDGNLFPKDGSQGRPEIYVMGCRNPYRISVDQKSGFLYWGDVGPDAGKDSLGRGPRGYDEVNQAREAGFFGWPYFIGNNYPYHEYDFAAQTASKEGFDPQKPINNSPNNTGIQELPPAQAAFIWYPYDASPEFPLVGEGGRNAMAGPVFHAKDFPESDLRYPEYYDGKLLIYDWMRGWMMAVSMDEEGNFVRMEPFLPSMELNNPVDMQFADDGSLYILEYGSRWFTQNPDARLVHIPYIAGNRQPLAKFEADKEVGAAPLTVNFNGASSIDFDGDSLGYEWSFGENLGSSDEVSPQFTFNQPGTYEVSLTIKDPSGESSSLTKSILVGNEPPEVSWNISGNQTFYFDNQRIDYEVAVQDAEDGRLGSGIAEEAVTISIDFLERGYDKTNIAQGHQAMTEASSAWLGKELIGESGCSACHQLNDKSVGPAYTQVASKYKDDGKALDYLAQKIISGGAGVWGEIAMAPHPHIKTGSAKQMAKYILSLSGKSIGDRMKPAGSYVLSDHIGKGNEGSYIFTASYSDKGGTKVGSLTSREVLVLKNPYIEAHKNQEAKDCMYFQVTPDMDPTKSLTETIHLMIANKGGYIKFSQIDMSGIKELGLIANAVSPFMEGGTIDIRLDAPDGEKIGSVEVDASLQFSMDNVKPIVAAIKPSAGFKDLYFTFDTSDEGQKPLVALVGIEFRQ